MANAAAIQNEIYWARQRNAAAQQEINRAYSEIRSCEARIAQLRKELADLEDFRSKSANDLNRMSSQADERRAKYSSLDSVQNVSAFLAFSEKMREAVDGTTKRSINTARDEITRQINRAAEDIRREIAELEARIASLQQVIRSNQTAISRNNRSISQLSSELSHAE